jgi:hypothetical protein
VDLDGEAAEEEEEEEEEEEGAAAEEGEEDTAGFLSTCASPTKRRVSQVASYRRANSPLPSM